MQQPESDRAALNGHHDDTLGADDDSSVTTPYTRPQPAIIILSPRRSPSPSGTRTPLYSPTSPQYSPISSSFPANGLPARNLDSILAQEPDSNGGDDSGNHSADEDVDEDQDALLRASLDAGSVATRRRRQLRGSASFRFNADPDQDGAPTELVSWTEFLAEYDRDVAASRRSQRVQQETTGESETSPRSAPQLFDSPTPERDEQSILSSGTRHVPHQQEGANNEPLWAVGAGSDLWLNEPVDIERNDRVPRGGSRLPRVNIPRADSLQFAQDDPRSPLPIDDSATTFALSNVPAGSTSRFNVRLGTSRSNYEDAEEPNNDLARFSLRPYTRAAPYEIFPTRQRDTRDSVQTLDLTSPEEPQFRVTSSSSPARGGVLPVRRNYLASRDRTTHAMMGRTLRMKKYCFLLYCGGSDGDSYEGGLDESDVTSLPPGWRWSSTTRHHSRPIGETQGCGALICARGYGSETTSSVDGSFVMTPQNWPSRERDKFWASDVPVRFEDVADVVDHGADDDEVDEAGLDEGFCSQCRKVDIACRRCGNVLGYRIIRMCDHDTSTTNLELDGMVWRFWRQATTSRHRLVGVKPAPTLEQEIEASQLVQNNLLNSRTLFGGQNKRVRVTNEDDGDQARIEPKMPTVGAKMKWGQLPHPQIDYEQGLVGEPKDWLTSTRSVGKVQSRDDDDDWWIAYSVNMHCQERISRSETQPSEPSRSNQQTDRAWRTNWPRPESAMPILIQGSNGLVGTETPRRSNGNINANGSSPPSSGSSLRRSGAIRVSLNTLLGRNRRRQRDGQDEAEHEGGQHEEDGSARDGRRVRARTAVDHDGHDRDGVLTVEREGVFSRFGYGAAHVGTMNRWSGARRVSALTLNPLTATVEARVGR
ncbi:hypothetical protein OIO90_002539 [Microbotryomycetes sp. JL221]|nr:hypothetical protein OIO90_002539 [Microbotryomycetes sp. JL221]